MASTGPSSSHDAQDLQEAHDVASEVAQDHTSMCSPCDSQNKQTKAAVYCLDCEEFLCTSCKELHQSFKLSKNHKFSEVSSDTAPCI